MSFAQQRVWFLQHLEPANPAYNRPLVMRFHGPLDLEALESGLKRIQERHETLRAVFDTEAGKPSLHISNKPLVTLDRMDLSSLPTQERQAALISQLQEHAQRVFNLRSEPILRASLLRVAEDDHVLSLVFHHLVFDRWSEEVFRNELGQLYQAHIGVLSEPLPELDAQYADFARWQRAWIESEAGKRQENYWMERLSGDLSTLELPIDARRPIHRSHAGAAVFFHLDENFVRLTRELSQRCGATLHSTMLAAFLVLLYRYSSQDDILLGIPAAGRVLPETESLIGLFVNTLASRHDLSGDPTVQELIRRVSRATLEDLSNQDYPFELVVQALNPSRDLRTTPLFQVIFNFENVPLQAVSMQPLLVESIEYDSGLAQFDLALEIDDQGQQLSCALSYNTDIFERDTIERMAGHYRTILEGFIADPQAHLDDLPLLTRAEAQQVGIGWDVASPEKPSTKNLQTWFEAQVDQTPLAVAVEYEGQTLTYAALNQRANRLAHTLIDLGVRPDHMVGLCVEPSINMVVGIFGILKAGGAYVPLDPSYPRERLQFMLQDANIDLVVSEETFLPKITRRGASILALDSQADRIAAMPGENPGVDVKAQDLAYVIYTSGSTGEPKGALITHGNVIQLFQASEKVYHFGAEDTWALFHSFTFDFTIWEIFGSLLNGGRLIVIPVSMRRSLDNYFEQVVFTRLTILNMIPPLFFEAARNPGFYERLSDSRLRQIFLGGDELDVARLKPFFQKSGASQIRVSNIYGPTETTVFVTWHDVTPQDLKDTLGSVIGRPLDGVSIYILDPNFNLLPVGISGEIVIGGPGVARGYLNRPELDRKRFIKHPLDPRPGSRFYRTGDRGKMRADGEIEFLGRQDFQVKVRGFRVEPGEVEAALQSHPAIAKAVVKLVDLGPQDKILAAYVVLEGGQNLQLSEMRAFLSDKLPDYMIPTAMKAIESIPLTPIGKIDWKALPDLGPRERDLQTSYVEPESELERDLQSIWKQVLNVAEVGVNDNFFNLGGHSLMALQLVAKVRELLSVELSVAALFQAPTVAQQAQLIRKRTGKPSAASLIPIREGGRGLPIFFIHWAGGSVLVYQKLMQLLDPEVRVFGLQAYGLDRSVRPHTTVEQMAAHYVDEIRKLQPHGPYYLAGASMGGSIAFEMARHLEAKGEKIGLVALFDTAGGPNLGALPLRERVRLHAGNIRQRKFQTAFGYLFERTVTRIRRFLYAAVIGLGIPLPSWMWNVKETTYYAFKHYRPGGYSGDVVLFRAMELRPGSPRSLFLGWEQVVSGDIEIIEIPGMHRTMLSEPNVQVVAEALNDILAKAQEDSDRARSDQKPGSDDEG